MVLGQQVLGMARAAQHCRLRDIADALAANGVLTVGDVLALQPQQLGVLAEAMSQQQQQQQQQQQRQEPRKPSEQQQQQQPRSQQQHIDVPAQVVRVDVVSAAVVPPPPS